MIIQNMVSGYSQTRLVILIMVMVLFAYAITACQPNQPNITPTTAEPTDFPAGFPTPDPEIFTACLADGGSWNVLGFNGPGCNLPTSDGGKACQDSKDCESGCLGDPNLVMREDEFGYLFPDHEQVGELNANNEENVGLCSPWKENFGCQVWLEKGHYAVICVD